MNSKLKKILSVFLASISILLLAQTAFAYPLGDVDRDNAVTVNDARMILRCAVGLEKMTTEGMKLADADGDGSITVNDARAVLRMAVGLSSPFGAALYAQSHQYLRKGVDDIKEFDIIYANLIYKTASKWCCYYSMNAVFRPALKRAGYSDEVIERVAPVYFEAEQLQKVEEYGNLFKNYGKKFGLLKNEFKVFVPSVLMDYYYRHPDAGTVYTMHDFYDDVVEKKMYYRSNNASKYVPKVGDFLFMSNKERTYVDGVPTIDHTAQIIEVYGDGTFLCTEGSIIDPVDGPDSLPRVRERKYFYNAAKGTYQFNRNSVVFVLTAVRPNLSE